MTQHHIRSVPAASANRATPPPSALESGHAPEVAIFDPVALRARPDGWTAACQTGFVEMFYTESQVSQRGLERDAMPTVEETDALIMEKIDALTGAGRWRRHAPRGRTKRMKRGGAYAAHCELPDEEEDGEDWDGEE